MDKAAKDAIAPSYPFAKEGDENKDTRRASDGMQQTSSQLIKRYNDSRAESIGSLRFKSGVGSGRIVLCAIDSSLISRYAFEWYLNNIWNKDDQVVLVHIPEPPALPTITLKSGLNVPAEEWSRTLQTMRSKMDKLVEDYEAECISRKLKYKMRGESFKNAGEGICIIAEEENADMIVLGSRDIGGLKRALMGSISEFVVRNAGIPCLVVRAKKLK